MFKGYAYKDILLHPLSLLIAGVLLGLATTLPYTFVLVFLGLVPFLILIEQRISLRDLLTKSFIFGAAFYGTVYSWFWGVFPLTWIGIQSPFISFAFLAFAWVTTIIVLALVMVFRAYLAKFLIQQHKEFYTFIVASVWVLFEYVGAVTFAILWSGKSALIGAHWTFGFLGYAVAEIPILRSLTAIGGIYLLSFTVVFIVTTVYVVCFHTRKIKEIIPMGVVIGVLCICAIVGYTSSFLDKGEQKEVALVHTVYPSKLIATTFEEKRERAEHIIEAMRNVEGKPQIILFPEGSAVLNVLTEQEKKDFLAPLVESNNDVLVLNPANNENADGNRISSVWYVRPMSGLIETRNKQFLTPVGEYAPYIGIFIANMFNVDGWLEATYEFHGYTPVVDNVNIFSEKEVGVLQCSEIISPVLYRELAQHHQLLGNAASHAPFSHTSVIREQTLKMARIHASANDRYFIQSGNIAPSFVISNTGAVKTFVNGEELNVISANVDLRTRTTPYTRWGEWFIVFVAFSILILFSNTQQHLFKRL